MEREKQGEETSRSLLWEEEPVLIFQMPHVELPPDTPRRVTAYYRRLEGMWQGRWEGTLYRRACAAAQTARDRSRPFEPWSAALTAEAAGEEGLLRVRWEAEELASGRRCLLAREDLWQLPGGTPAGFGQNSRKKKGNAG